MKFKSLFKVMAVFLAMTFTCCSGGSKEAYTPTTTSVPVTVVLPQTISVVATEPYTFTTVTGRGVKTGDELIFTDESDVSTTLEPQNIADKSFDIVFPTTFVSGKYSVTVTRGDLSKKCGSLTINVSQPVSDDLVLQKTTTIYGWVKCSDKPLAGVPVSDGYEMTATNDDGMYELPSKKANGYVFISIPSGYKVTLNGVIPQFFSYLTKDSTVAERVDFTLYEDPGQENHTMLIFGDIHLAARTNDRSQFTVFTDDVKSYLSQHTSDKIYAMTLGDMTWDAYWYTNNYCFTNYLNDVSPLNGLYIYHTIGNHDHDMNYAGDWDTVTKYKQQIGPTYYSFNIGKVHYVSLDNIECTNTSGQTTSDRHYVENLVSEDLEWLRKDLSYVDKSTPVVLAMHAPLYTQTGTYNMADAAEFESCVAGYNVHVVTGHTHKMWNVDKIASKGVYENNSGAVCATWWWTGYYTQYLNIAQDGAPAGWRIMKVTGTDLDWQYKGTDRSTDCQFFTYDRNTINFTASDLCPAASSTYVTAFDKNLSTWGWYGPNTDNYVYINVWDWDATWKISVTENGTALTCTRMLSYDPLFIASYSAKRYNKSTTPTFSPFKTYHMFRVQASTPTSTLVITVTDRFGRTYTETMTRPKTFDIKDYASR